MGICNRCNKHQRYSVQKYKFQSVDLFWEGNWKKLPIPWPFNMQLYSFSTIFVLPYQIHHRNLLRFSMTFEMVGFNFLPLVAEKYLLIIKVGLVKLADHLRFITRDTRPSPINKSRWFQFVALLCHLFPLNCLRKNHWRSKLVFKKIQNRGFMGVKKAIWLISCWGIKMVSFEQNFTWIFFSLMWYLLQSTY